MSEEQSFDRLAQALAKGYSRKRVLRIGAGAVGATVVGAFSGPAWGRNLGSVDEATTRIRRGGGNSDCAHFCQSLPPGSRGDCVSTAAHNDPAGFCARCAADVTRICGTPTKQVCCDPTQGQLCCPTQGAVPQRVPAGEAA